MREIDLYIIVLKKLGFCQYFDHDRNSGFVSPRLISTHRSKIESGSFYRFRKISSPTNNPQSFDFIDIAHDEGGKVVYFNTGSNNTDEFDMLHEDEFYEKYIYIFRDVKIGIING